ncbi:MAG: tetratricopeptide repeat protein [Limisphaera sp.]
MTASTKVRGWKLWLGRLALSVLVPGLLVGLAELGLRWSGYGWPTSYFVPGESEGRPCWVENDRFAWRFFPRGLERHPPPTLLRAERPPGSCRIFVLGESAAMGDPRPAYSMGRYLQVLLEERYPGRQFEVVTVAMTAINSHALLPMARDCARHGGDIWILYIGNNEMVGPFGALDVLGPAAPPWLWVRARLAAQEWRLGQALQDTLDRWRRRPVPPGGWAGMEMFSAQRLPPGDPRRERAYRNFERNLRDILKVGLQHGVRILVSPAAVNLKDCPPFASVPGRMRSGATTETLEIWLARGAEAERGGQWAAAAEAYGAAVALAPEHAGAQYRLARVLLRLGRREDAHRAFQAACDSDALPFRADSRIQTLTRQVVEQMHTERVRWLDAAAVLAARSGDGIPGRESFFEHVHLNPEGNYALARAFAEQLEDWLPQAATASAQGEWLSESGCADRLALTDWNRISIYEDLRRRLRQPPFTAQADHEAELRWIDSQLEALRARRAHAQIEQARRVYAAALERRPGDHRLYENQAEFLEAVGDLEAAVGAWAAVTRILPHHHLGWFQQGRLLARLGRLEEAEQALKAAVTRRPELSEGWLELGQVLLRRQRAEAALECFARAHEWLPQDWRAPFQMGRALQQLNRRAEAIELFRLALRLNSEAVEPRFQLAQELAFAGRTPEAREMFEEVLRRDPSHLLARINLGVALVQLGQLEAAAEQFRRAQAQAPQNPLVSNYLAQVESRLGRRP